MLMLQLALIVLGAAYTGLGAVWAGAVVGRSNWLGIGVPALLLVGITVFTASDRAPLAVWAFAATAAVFTSVAAATVSWGVVGDATLGLFALFFVGAAALSTGGWANRQGEFTIEALGTLFAALAAALVVAGALVVPRVLAFRRVAGWLLVVAGISVAFLGYARSIDVAF